MSLKTRIIACLITLTCVNAWASLDLEDIHKVTDADTLTLFFFPSPHGVNWNNPRKLARSIVKNYTSFKDRRIGHVAVSVNCRSSAKEFLTGQTDAGMNAVKSLFIQRDGFYILFDYFPGELEKAEDLSKEVVKKLKNGRVSTVTYKVSPSTCERLIQYKEEYEARGDYRWYGLANRPRYGEGAGCSAWGKSFVDVAGFYLPEYDRNWGFDIRIPMKFIGGPYNDVKVPFRKVYFKKSKWAKANEPHMRLKFWDPDAMHSWVIRKARAYQNGHPSDYIVRRAYRSFHLVYDRQDIPTPTEDIWKQ